MDVLVRLWPAAALLCGVLLTVSAAAGAEAKPLPRGYTIPTIDLAGETERQTIVDREKGQYLGHPTTVLLEDGKTMLAVYPKGHGAGAIVLKRSADGGRTWSERLPVPESWATSRETPTLYRTVDAKGVRRLILFSGLYPIRMAVSEDDGATWSPLEPIGDFGGVVAMASCLRLADGSYMALFHDDGRFIHGGAGAHRGSPMGRSTGTWTVYKTLSTDGGLTWSAPEPIARATSGPHLCEPGAIRSPDGRQIAVLLRENSRRHNSFVIFSDDEGRTWTEPRQLPAALTGDRHVGRYAPDGRLVVSFRDTTLESPTKGDWVLWVGTYDDIRQGREGQYRVRLMDNHKGADCAYPALELLPDGTFVATTYGHWTAGEAPYIASVRFRLSEIDGRAPKGVAAPRQPAATLFYDASQAPVAFAAEEVGRALGGPGKVALFGLDQVSKPVPGPRIVLATRDDEAVRDLWQKEVGEGVPALQAQGFAVRRRGPRVLVVGGDAVGAMYGGLDVAETIRLDGLGAVAGKDARPAIARRGVKFNIPLDARTPSYDDSGDAAQANIVHMWDFAFWEAYLDAMARARYNVLSLWNPHPFPSMVRLEKYPDVALDDVCVSRIKPTSRHGSIGEHMGVSNEVLANVEVVRKMPIDEKIAFWRKVMKHAADRGIEVYLITWNVLTNSAGGKYGIDDRQDNPRTIAYLRECVRQTILTYPDLTGLGVTAGERMQDRKDEFAKEKWLWKAYGEGVVDAGREQPDRNVRFIHRVWQTGAGEVAREWADYPGDFEVSFKYARARLYSSTKPPFSRGLEKDLKAHGLKSWWNLRNDDIFVFRWGDPDYVREFLGNLPPADLTAGYYVGSDGYAWGREFVSTEPDEPRRLEIEKHAYRFMLWGRLGYDPALDRAFFTKVLAHRLPQAGPEAQRLYLAWQEASKVIPLVNRFHWRNWDYLWAVEGCMDQPKGFHTVRDFIDNPTMEGSGLVPIKAYAEALLKGEAPTAGTPPEVAARLASHAKLAVEGVAALRSRVPEPAKELRRTLGDIEAMGHLGRYYAAKILGATELALFERTGEAAHKEKAVAHLERGVGYWQDYAAVATRQYRPQLLARTRELDWMRLLEDVKKDVDIARRAGQ